MLRFALMIMLCAGILPNLEAGIVEHDFRAPGDGLLTYDEIHKREWLDLTETEGWDLTTLQQAISAGGALSNYTLANFADIQSLAASAGATWLPVTEYLFANDQSAWNFSEFVGGEIDWKDEPDGFNTEDPGYRDIDKIEFGSGPDALITVSGYFAAVNTSRVAVFNLIFAFGDYTYPGFATWPSGQVSFQDIPVSSEVHVQGPYWLYRTVPEPNCSLLFVMFTIMVGRRARNSNA